VAETLRDRTHAMTGMHHTRHTTGFGEDEDNDEDLLNASYSSKLHVIGVSARAGGVAGGFLGNYDAQNSDSCRYVPYPCDAVRQQMLSGC
jgi:hypothetical protein